MGFGTVSDTIGAFREFSGPDPVRKLFWEKGLIGATRRDRTGDLLITNQPLYQLS
jgi:hypothetical protein